MDEDVEVAARLVQKEWEDAIVALSEKMRALEECGSPGRRDKAALPRLNAAVQDRLSAMQSLIVRFEYLAQQLPRTSLKSYELSRVYRRSVGDNAPREYFQGDFDTVGGAQILAEAEAVKVVVEVVSKFPVWDVSEIRVNHRQILRAIWNFQSQLKQKVIQILAVLGSAPPQSSARKALWPIVRRQLLQGLLLPEAIVDRLQAVERRLTGSANEVLPRLRGALGPSMLSDLELPPVEVKVEACYVLIAGSGKGHQHYPVSRVILVVGIFFFLSICIYITLKRFGILRLMRSVPPIYSTHVPIATSTQGSLPEADDVYDLL